MLPSPLLDLPGAVPSPDPADTAVAWHYGDPLREQRARLPLVDGWGCGVVRVGGTERISWLQALGSQDFEALTPGAWSETLALTPQGRVLHWAAVTVADGAAWLVTRTGEHAAALATWLESMRFRADVTIADMSAEYAMLTVDGQRRLVARDAFGARAAALIRDGAQPIGSWAAAALRVSTRTPRFGVDNDDRTLPNETRWLDTAVAIGKGCYPGQETVAKILNVGAPPRRIVLLNLDGSGGTLPAVGAAVVDDAGRTAGRVGTVAQHWELGPVALALIKRTIGSEVPLLADGVDARVDTDDPVVERAQPGYDPRQFIDFRRR